MPYNMKDLLEVTQLIYLALGGVIVLQKNNKEAIATTKADLRQRIKRLKSLRG